MAIWTAAALGLIAALLHVASIAIAITRCAVRRSLERPRPDAPAVSLVRPVCGLDNYVEDTLRSAFELDYPRYELIFCVAFAKDPVVPLVERLIADHPHVRARLLIGDERISDNPKLNNVYKGWRAAAHDWIVVADSNVLMPPDYIQRLLATWRPDTGLVCSPPVGVNPDGVWAELESAFLNTYQARWQYVVDTLGFGFAQGKTMLWRRSDLERLGGIRLLGAEIAEDAAATKLLRDDGLRVRLVDGPFGQPLGRRSAIEVWHRQVRWARIRRATFPLQFLPEVLAGGAVPFACIGIAAAAADTSVLAALGAYAGLWYGAEALLARTAGWPLSWRAPLTWLMRDLLLPVVWVYGWTGTTFVWRGNAMKAVSGSTP